MIKVDLREENVITIKGHALFSDFGTDIVCASVSSIVITTINDVMSIDNDAIEYESKTGKVVIKIKKKSDIVSILIDNMILLLESLEKDYSENIKIIRR